MADNFARGLVIQNHTWRNVRKALLYDFAIDTNLILPADTLPNMGWLAVNRHAPLQNQFFHVATRSHACLGQHFMEFWANHFVKLCATFGVKCRHAGCSSLHTHAVLVRVGFELNQFVAVQICRRIMCCAAT